MTTSGRGLATPLDVASPSAGELPVPLEEPQGPARGALRAMSLLLLGSGGFIAASSIVQGALPVGLLVLGILGTLICLPLRSKWDPWQPAVLAACGGVIVALLLGLPLAVTGTDYGQTKVTQLVTLVPLLLLGSAALMTTTATRQKYALFTVFLGVLATLIALVAPDATAAESARLSIDGGSTIGLGRAIGAAIVVLLAFARTARPTRAVGTIAIVAALLSVSLSVGSRAPLVGAAVAIALLYATRSRIKFLVLVGLAAVAGSWALGQVSEGAVSSRLTTVNDASSMARLQLLRTAWESIVHNPLGIGWGGLDVLFASDGGTNGLQYPHNVVAEIAAEAGWLPAVVFVFFVVWALRRQFRRTGIWFEDAIFSLAVFFFINALLSNDVTSNRAMWILLGACAVSTVLPSRPRGTASQASSPTPSNT